MTHLRKMMLEELQRRNYAKSTISSYIRVVEDFSRRFNRAPDRLGPKHIREYQSELFTKRKFAASTVTIYLAALRFFYTKTLKRTWSTAETPYPKKVFPLPTILSQEEVAQLIDSALTPYHRTLLMTLYATGVRRAELTRLKVTDVDSKRMVIHVQGGKGRRDRDVMLSPKLLDELREHWRRLKQKNPYSSSNPLRAPARAPEVCPLSQKRGKTTTMHSAPNSGTSFPQISLPRQRRLNALKAHNHALLGVQNPLQNA